MKTFLERLFNDDGGFKIFVCIVAAFCTIFSLCTASDIGRFYADYWAGALTACALFICLDDDEYY